MSLASRLDEAAVQSGQWTHHRPQSASAMEPDQFSFFIYLFINLALNPATGEWAISSLAAGSRQPGLHYLRLPADLHRGAANVWINLCPRTAFWRISAPPAAIAAPPKFHSKIWDFIFLQEIITPTLIESGEKKIKCWHESDNSLWKHVELIDYSCGFCCILPSTWLRLYLSDRYLAPASLKKKPGGDARSNTCSSGCRFWTCVLKEEAEVRPRLSGWGRRRAIHQLPQL